MSADRALANQAAADLCWLLSAAPVVEDVSRGQCTWMIEATTAENGIW